MQNPSVKKKRIKIDSSFLKIGQAAQALGVSIDTLRRWEKAGKISTVRTPGGTRLYHISALKEINPAAEPYPIETYQSDSLSTEELLKRVEKDTILGYKQSLPSSEGNDTTETEESLSNIPAPKSSFVSKFLIGSAFVSTITLLLTSWITASYLTQPKSAQQFFKNNIASPLFSPFHALAEEVITVIDPRKAKELGFAPPEDPPPIATNYKLRTLDSSVLAVTASSQFLEVNADTQINGALFVRDSVNGLSLEATPSANSFVLGSGDTTLTVTNDALLDQDVSTLASPTFNTLNLSATSNQLVFQSGGPTGTLTWTPTAARVITLPDATGTVLLDSATQTITNKTINASNNTITNIPNSALSNNKITVTAGTNLTGGGDITLGSSATISLKDSISLSGTLTAGGVVKLADGTAAAPGLTFTNDTDTGLYRIGANSIGLITGGSATSGITIDSSGNLGIGTISPGAALEVNGQVKITGGTPGSNKVLTSDSSGLASWTSVAGVGGVTGTGTAGYIPVFDSSSSITNSSTIWNSGGNVGIGTTAPNYTFRVNGTGYFSDFVGIGSSLNVSGNVGIGQSLTVTSGTVLSGGLVVNGGSVVLPAGSIGNSELENSSISVSATAGTGISVSGSPVSLGGTLTVSGIDASTTVKGVASFNSTNFSVSSGAVNTIQDIATSATPTFVGLNTTSGNVGIGTSATGSRLAVNGNGVIGWGTAAVAGPANGLAVFGNVGIGTTSPGYKLDVVGQINGSTGLCIAGDCKTAWSGVGGYTASNGLTLSGTDFQLGGSLTRATGIDIASQNFGFLGGNVGIGNSNPDYALKVTGTGYFSSFVGIGSSLNVSGNVGIGQSLTVTSGTVLSGGLVVNGGSVVLPAGSIGNSELENSSISVSATAGTGISVSGSPVSLGGTLTVSGIDASTTVKGVASFNSTNFSVSSGAVNTIQDIATSSSPTFVGLSLSSGNLGIGTSSTGAKLQVNGNGIFWPSTTALTGPTNGLAVFGNVGVGTTSPAAALEVIGAAILRGNLTFNADNSFDIGAANATRPRTGYFGTSVQSGVAMDADVSGFFGTPMGYFAGNASSDIPVVIVGTGANIYGAEINGLKTRATSTNANTIVQNGDELMALQAFGADGASYRQAAGIYFYVDGTPGSSDMPGRIDFATSPDDTITPITRMTIKNTGNIGIGATLPQAKLVIQGNVGIGYTGVNQAIPDNGLAVFGNVGIGTTTANSNLSISGNVHIGSLYQGTVAPTNGLFVDGNVGIGATTSSNKLDVWGAANITGNVGIGSSLTVGSAGVFSGGLVVNGGSVVLPAGSIGNSELENSSITVSATAGTGISVSGSPVSLGGTLTVSGIDASTTVKGVASFNSTNFSVTSGAVNTIQDIATSSSPTFVGLSLSSGNLGIGTSTTGAKLQVNGNGIFWPSTTSLTGPTNGLAVFGNVGIGTTTANSNLSVAGSAHIGALYQSIAAPANGLFVDGNVGIGATTSSNKLDVWGNSRIAGNLTLDGTLTTNGTITPSGQFLAIDGSKSAPSYSFASSGNGDNGMYLPSANALSFSTAGNDVLTLTAGGNVGIGTTSPSQKLEINGNGLLNATRPELQLLTSGTGKGRVAQYAEGAAYLTANLYYDGTNWNRDNTSIAGSVVDISDQIPFRLRYVASGANPATLTESIRINTNGNVGIGLTTANSQLSISNNVHIGSLYQGTVAPTNGLFVDGNVGIGATTSSNKLDVWGAANITGNVGIGGSLTVGSAGVFSGGLTVNGGSVVLPAGSIGNSELENSSITVSATAGTGISVSGSPVSLGGTLTVSGIDASTSVKGVASFNSTNFSVSSGAVNTIQDIATTSSPTFVGLSLTSGNLGIGTSSTGAKLQVNGGGIFWPSTTALTGPTNGLAVFGNVGIGTTSPLAPLHTWGNGTNSALFLNGNVGIGFTSPDRLTQLASDINITGSLASLLGATGTQFGITGSSGSGGTEKKLVLGIDTTDNYGVLQAGNTSGTAYNLALNPAGGNIGIGTTSPAAPLHILGVEAQLRLEGTSSGQDAAIDFYPFTPAGAGYRGQILVTHGADADAGRLQLQLANTSGTLTTRLYIEDGGNLGIGTDTTPDYLLELYDATNTPAFGLSDDDVAHGVTTIANTDTFFHLSSISTTVGGAQISGLADATGVALGLKGIQSSDPTDSTPAISLIGAKANGTGVQDLADAETILQIANNDNAPALTILGNGNVGIGATIPNATLSIQGNVGIGYTGVNQVIPSNGLAVFGNVGIGTTTANSNLSVAGSAHIGALYQSIAAPANGLFVDGNVGIGATTSSNKLDVWGNARVAGTTTIDSTLTALNGLIGYSGITAPSSGLAVSGNVGIGFTSPSAKLQLNNGQLKLSIDAGRGDTDGRIIIDGRGSNPVNPALFLYANTSANAPSINFYDDTGSTVYGRIMLDRSTSPVYTGTAQNDFVLGTESGTNKLHLGTNSIARLTVDSAGNIGIGITTVNSLLSVAGGAHIGALYQSIAAPANGLFVDGNVGIGATTSSNKLDVWGNARIAGTLTVDSTLTNSSVFRAANGSATAPSYSFTDSTSTGLWSPSANALSLTTNGSGTSGITITAGGNVGIGVTNPVGALQVNGAAAIGYGSIPNSSLPSNGLAISGSVGIGTTSPGYPLSVNGAIEAKTIVIGVGGLGDADGGAIWMRADSASQIPNGTGTGQTQANLKVSGTRTGMAAFKNAAAAGTRTLEVYNGTDTQVFQVDNAGGAYFAGNVGIGLTTANSQLSISNNVHIGSLFQGTVAPTNGLFVDGNVGIGATTSSNKLDVWGNSRIAGTLSLDSSLTLAGGQFLAPNGTSALPSFSFSGDTDTGLWNLGTNFLALTTNGAGALQAGSTINGLSINANGNVGIGTTNPTATLDVAGATSTISNTTGNLTITPASNLIISSGNVGIGFTSPDRKLQIGSDIDITGTAASILGANGAQFSITGSSANTTHKKLTLGIDTTDNYGVIQAGNTNGTAYDLALQPGGGNVGIGTTNPSRLLHIVDASADNNFMMNTYRTSASADIFTTQKARGTLAAPTIVASGDDVIAMTFQGYDGAAFRNVAAIRASINAAPGASDMPGSLTFFTTSDGSVTLSERMRIDSAGNVGIGTTVPNPGSLLELAGNLNIIYNGNPKITLNDAGGAGRDIVMQNGGGGTTGDLGFTFNGSTRVVFQPGGNVGIGTTGPSTHLDIQAGSQYSDIRIRGTGNTRSGWIRGGSDDDAGTSFLEFGVGTTYGSGGKIRLHGDGNVGIGTVSPVANLHLIGSGTGTAKTFMTQNSTKTNFGLTALDNGNVGIGTTSPSTILGIGDSLDQTTYWSTSYLERAISVVNHIGTDNKAMIHLEGNQSFGNGVVDGIIFRNYQSTHTADDRTIAAIVAITNTSYDAEAGNLAFYTHDTTTGYAERMRIDSTGNVGIGIAAPSGVFQVGSSATAPVLFASSLTGNVGIGTSVPSYPLDVPGNTTIPGSGYTIPARIGINESSNGNNFPILEAKSTAYWYYRTAGNAHGWMVGAENDGTDSVFEIARATTGGGLVTELGSRVRSFIIDYTNQNVGIGLAWATLPSYKLEVNGNFYIGDTSAPGNTTVCYDGAGGSAIGGCTSLRELKTNIQDLNIGLNELMQLRPVSFDWKSGLTNDLGFIAEEVEAIAPILSTYKEDGTLQGVKYNTITALLTKAIQEQQAEINNLIANQATSSAALSTTLSVSADGTLNVPKLQADKITLSADMDFATAPLNALISTTDGMGITSTTGGGYDVDVLASLNSISEAVLGIQSQESTTSAQLASLESTVASQSANLASLESNIASQSTTTQSLAEQLASAAAELAQTRSDVEELKLTPPDILLATTSAQLVNLEVTSDATISGQLTAYDLDVQNALKSLGTTTLGNTLVAGDFTVDGTLSVTGNSINVIGTLFLQNSPLADGVDFFNGAVTIDKTGTLAVNKIALPAEVLGEAIIPAGSLEIPVFTSAVTQKSKIFLTPTTLTGGQPLIMSEIISGSGFVVALEKPFSSDIKFNWVILDQR